MTMLDGALDVETVDQPATRSPDTRAAVAYLVASGATAISIIETEMGCSFRVGTKLDHGAVTVQWLPETNARALLKLARQRAGKSPDAATALAQAAADLGVTLTPHHVAMARAGDAAARIEQYIQSLRWSGKMREFTRAYKRRRTAAAASGQGFMTYAVAELRLRQALVPLLVNGGSIGPVQSLFAQIFER